jgi:hypothetical protein
MKSLRPLSALAAAVVLAVVVGCSDDSLTAPPPPPEPALIGEVTERIGWWVSRPATDLLSCPQTETFSVSKEIGPDGGIVQVGGHTLLIPKGALLKPETITATAPAGQFAEVRFGPHGLQFERPVVLTMSYKNCGLVRQFLPPRIVYADDTRQILETLLTLPDIFRKTVSTATDHFSGYLLAE